MSDIKIPENAIELIDQTLARANELIEECGDCYKALDNPDMGHDTMFEECYHKIKSFISHFETLPHRWAGFNHLKWEVGTTSHLGSYFLLFSNKSGIEKIDIPYELYLVLNIGEPEEKTGDTNYSNFIEEAIEYGDRIINRLKLFKNFLMKTTADTKNKINKKSNSRITPLKNNLGIVIPENGIDLIFELFKIAKSVEGYFKEHVEEHEGYTITESDYKLTMCFDEFCDDYIKLKRTLENFAYRWAKFDPVIWRWMCESSGDRYFFRFFHPDVPPGLGLGQAEQLREIPYDLYMAFTGLQYPENLESDDDYSKVKKAAQHIILHLQGLFEFLRMREESIRNPLQSSELSREQNINIVSNVKPPYIPKYDSRTLEFPENAIGIINGIIIEIKSTMEHINLFLRDKAFYNNDKSLLGGDVQECVKGIKRTNQILDDLPYKWAKFDPFRWEFYPYEWGPQYFFKFFTPPIPPDYGDEELYEIPHELFMVYNHLESVKINENDDDFFDKSLELCENIVSPLENLRHRLELRKECAINHEYEFPPDSQRIQKDKGDVNILRTDEFSFYNIKVAFIDYHTVNIYLPSEKKPQRRDFKDFKANSKKNNKPMLHWDEFIKCIENDGLLVYAKNPDEKDARKQTKLKIKTMLQDFFHTNDDPFEKYQRKVGWKLKLQIKNDQTTVYSR